MHNRRHESRTTICRATIQKAVRISLRLADDSDVLDRQGRVVDQMPTAKRQQPERHDVNVHEHGEHRHEAQNGERDRDGVMIERSWTARLARRGNSRISFHVSAAAMDPFADHGWRPR